MSPFIDSVHSFIPAQIHSFFSTWNESVGWCVPVTKCKLLTLFLTFCHLLLYRSIAHQTLYQSSFEPNSIGWNVQWQNREKRERTFSFREFLCHHVIKSATRRKSHAVRINTGVCWRCGLSDRIESAGSLSSPGHQSTRSENHPLERAVPFFLFEDFFLSTYRSPGGHWCKHSIASVWTEIGGKVFRVGSLYLFDFKFV